MQPQRQSLVLAALSGAIVAAILLSRVDLPRAYAQSAGGGSDMFAVVGPGNAPGHNVLFVVDPETAHLLVFEYKVGNKLELAAARDLRWDVQMPQFPPNGPKVPSPPVDEVEDAIKKLQAGGGAGGGGQTGG